MKKKEENSSTKNMRKIVVVIQNKYNLSFLKAKANKNSGL